MLKTCAICAKSVSDWVVNPAHPEKPICLKCMNGFVLNLNTIEKELTPLANDLSKAIDALKDDLDKRQA